MGEFKGGNKMIKNTSENKARFFALYWGQNCAWMKIPHEIECLEKVSDYSITRISYLELTPLSQITDEDAFTIANIFHPDGDFAIEFNSSGVTSVSPYGLPCYTDTIDITWKGEVSYERSSSTTKLQAYDCLRSKGYALPYMGVSVEKLQEWGWVKLKEVQK